MCCQQHRRTPCERSSRSQFPQILPGMAAGIKTHLKCPSDMRICLMSAMRCWHMPEGYCASFPAIITQRPTLLRCSGCQRFPNQAFAACPVEAGGMAGCPFRPLGKPGMWMDARLMDNGGSLWTCTACTSVSMQCCDLCFHDACCYLHRSTVCMAPAACSAPSWNGRCLPLILSSRGCLLHRA